MTYREKHCLGNLLMFMDMEIAELNGYELSKKQKEAKEGIASHYPEFQDSSLRHEVICSYLDELFVKEA